MGSSMLRAGAVLWVGLAAVAAASPAPAQAPPPQAAEIAACLCLKQAVDALGVEMTTKQRSYDALRDALARLDSQLQGERAGIDVNNPQSVARFRQLLERRDAAFRRSTGPVAAASAAAAGRYNQRVDEFNARCANQPRDPILLGQVQATLSCPAPY